MARSFPIRDLSLEVNKLVLTTEVTPKAALALLLEADGLPLALALTPYIGAARLAEQPSTGPRWWLQPITPGVQHGRVAVGRRATSAPVLPAPVELTTATGGTGTADVVQVVLGQGVTVADLCNTSTLASASMPVVSAPDIEDAPVTAQPRQLELAENDAPGTELMSIAGAQWCSLLVSGWVADIETL